MSQEIENLIHRINRTWLERRPNDLEPLLHPDAVMVFPGFGGRTRGASAMIAGFEEFCTTATVHSFDTSDLQIDVVGNTAVASFAFTMVYERDGRRFSSTGRDLWMFGREDGRWKAHWRTMADLEDEELS